MDELNPTNTDNAPVESTTMDAPDVAPEPEPQPTQAGDAPAEVATKRSFESILNDVIDDKRFTDSERIYADKCLQGLSELPNRS